MESRLTRIERLLENGNADQIDADDIQYMIEIIHMYA